MKIQTLLATAAVALLLGALTYFSQDAVAQQTNPQPVLATGTSNSATATQVVASNPTRRSVRICNTGGTNALWVWATTATSCTTLVSSFILAPVTSNVITCYTPPTGAGGTNTNIGSRFCALGTTTFSVEEYN